MNSTITCSPRSAAPTTIVAIPVCNEVDRIGACLTALSMQTGLEPRALGILLFLNNCSDGTADAVARCAPMPWQVRVIERTHPDASAGWARRIAMDEAAAWLHEHGSGGVLMTSDADSRVAPDWVARNLRAIAAGADAVAGRIVLDPVEAAVLPSALHARGRREAAYEALLIEISARLDPEAGNPWPNHWSKSGATIAVKLAVYEAVGGMPDQPTGEDRAFVDAVASRDFVVRHDPEIVVVTSGRLDGRAAGGVADTIRLRCEIPESPCDDRLEPAIRVVARCLSKCRLRRLHAAGRLRETDTWAPRLGIAAREARRIAERRFFGDIHAAIERASPRLRYAPVRPGKLAMQIFVARLVLAVLRVRDRLSAAPFSRGHRLQAPRPKTT